MSTNSYFYAVRRYPDNQNFSYHISWINANPFCNLRGRQGIGSLFECHDIFAKSHVEKNFGLISITTWVPCCALCNIILAIGWSSVPRYFIFIFSPYGTVFFGSSNIVMIPLPLTPLYGKFSSSMEKYTSGLAFIFSTFFAALGVIINSFTLFLS